MVAKPHSTVSWNTWLQLPIPRTAAMRKREGAAHPSRQWGRKSIPIWGYTNPCPPSAMSRLSSGPAQLPKAVLPRECNSPRSQHGGTTARTEGTRKAAG